MLPSFSEALLSKLSVSGWPPFSKFGLTDFLFWYRLVYPYQSAGACAGSVVIAKGAVTVEVVVWEMVWCG